MGAGGGTLERIFEKQLECRDNRCALGLLTSVHSNTAQNAIGPPCFQVMLPASAYQDHWDFFSADLLLG